jgi:dihydrolipoamide dehydrogenase
VLVNLGDKVGEGAVLIRVEAAGAACRRASPARRPAAAAIRGCRRACAGGGAAPAASHAGAADAEYDMVVLGAGPGGYSAAFRAADLGLKTAIIERYATLGGVCLNVGCIPSKALLHVAAVIDEAEHMSASRRRQLRQAHGGRRRAAESTRTASSASSPVVSPAWPRRARSTSSAATALPRPQPPRSRRDHRHQPGQDRREEGREVQAGIIAAGSAAVHLPFMPRDPRIVDSTGALELRQVPGKMLVIGGGIIGLEMATVYSTLGARVDVVEMLDGLMQGPDRDAVKVWEKQNAHRFDKIMLKTKTVGRRCEGRRPVREVRGRRRFAGAGQATT